MPERRIPIVRRDADGSVREGTAALSVSRWGVAASDFRDIDGQPMPLPPGSRFEFRLPRLIED